MFNYVKIFTLLAIVSFVHGQANYATNQLTTSALPERGQRALFTDVQGSFVLPITTASPTANRVDNAAGRQFQADKSAWPFLSTLPNQGSAVFLTALKPCGSILYHTHLRATEQYVVIKGTMTGGIAEENGGRQNLTFTVNAGQSMVVPQGVVHYNQNKDCTSLVFIQTFNSADPGTITLGTALTGLGNTNPTEQTVANITSSVSQFGALGLDQQCLQRCGLTATNNNLNDLSNDLKIFLGLLPFGGSPAAAPSSGAGSSG